jgi:hypothetical protein
MERLGLDHRSISSEEMGSIKMDPTVNEQPQRLAERLKIRPDFFRSDRCLPFHSSRLPFMKYRSTNYVVQYTRMNDRFEEGEIDGPKERQDQTT